jgi:hypothetical protein
MKNILALIGLLCLAYLILSWASNNPEEVSDVHSAVDNAAESIVDKTERAAKEVSR